MTFKGPIKKGEKRNPTGNNGFGGGLQPYKKRCEHYLLKYDNDGLLALESDPALFGKLTSWDAIAVRNLCASIKEGNNMRAERESLLDRLEGKPTQKHEVRVIRSFSDLREDELAALTAEAENQD